MGHYGNRRRRYASNIGVAFGIYDWSHHKSLEDLVTIPTKLSDNGLHHHGNQNYNICGLTAEHEIVEDIAGHVYIG